MCSQPISVAAEMVAFELSLHILSRVKVRLIWGQGAGASPLVFCLLLRWSVGEAAWLQADTEGV